LWFIVHLVSPGKFSGRFLHTPLRMNIEDDPLPPSKPLTAAFSSAIHSTFTGTHPTFSSYDSPVFPPHRAWYFFFPPFLSVPRFPCSCYSLKMTPESPPSATTREWLNTIPFLDNPSDVLACDFSPPLSLDDTGTFIIFVCALLVSVVVSKFIPHSCLFSIPGRSRKGGSSLTPVVQISCVYPRPFGLVSPCFVPSRSITPHVCRADFCSIFCIRLSLWGFRFTFRKESPP